MLGKKDIEGYLRRYGYLRTERDVMTQAHVGRKGRRRQHVGSRRGKLKRKKRTNRGALKLAISDLQQFAEIKKTGKLDHETHDLIGRKRCPHSDPVPMVATRSNAHGTYLQPGGTIRKWGRVDLTYRINSYPGENRLLAGEVDETIARAFQVWADVTPLTFRPVPKKPDIDIEFARGKHGNCRLHFDGSGNTLAHAYFPGEGLLGDVHFDAAERWTIQSPQGTNLFIVAVHELGHSLGLDHADHRDAVMFPWYPGYLGSSYLYQLPAVDVTAIQALYGVTPSQGAKVKVSWGYLAYRQTHHSPAQMDSIPRQSDPVIRTLNSVTRDVTRLQYPSDSRRNDKIKPQGFLAHTSYSGVWVSYLGSTTGQENSRVMTCATIGGEESVSQAVAMVMAHNPQLVQSEVTSRGDGLQESVLQQFHLMGAFEAHWDCLHSPKTSHYTSCYRSVQLSGVSASARIGSASAKIGSRSASVGKTRMKQPVCIGITTPSGKEGSFQIHVDACPAGEVPDVPSQPLFAMVGNPEVDERHVVCAGNLLRTEGAADLLCVSHPELWLTLKQVGRTVRAAMRPECGVKPCGAGTGDQADGDQAKEKPTDVKTGKKATKQEEKKPGKLRKTKLEYCVQHQVTQEAPEQECADLCSYQNSNCRQFFSGSPWPASSYTAVCQATAGEGTPLYAAVYNMHYRVPEYTVFAISHGKTWISNRCVYVCPQVCQTTAGEGTPLYAAVYNMHYRVPEYTASAITRDPAGKTYERPDSDLWYRVQLGLCPTELHEAIEDDCDNNTATWGITGKDDLCPLPSDVTDMLWRYGDCGRCQSLSGDYSGCGYYFNRGHLNPNSINNQTQDVQEGTFSLLNSAPQAADFNQCTWQPYECAVGLIAEKVYTKAAGAGSDVRSIYVITGTKLGRGHKWLKGRAAIPDFYWKAVCYPGDETKGIAPFAFAFYGANRNCTRVKTVELSVFEEWLYRGSVYPESRLFPGSVCEGNVSVWTDDNRDSFETFLEKVTPECRKGTGDLETRCANPDREACQKPSKPVAPPVKPPGPQGGLPPPPPPGTPPMPADLTPANVTTEDKCIMYKATDEAPVDRCMERCANNYQSWQECPNFFVGTPWPPSSYRFHTELRIPEYTADAIVRAPDGLKDPRDDDGTLWNRVQLGLCSSTFHDHIRDTCDFPETWWWGVTKVSSRSCRLSSSLYLEECGDCQGLDDNYDGCGTYADRGHLNPNAINNRDEASREATFSFINVAPQAPHFNRHVWESFEEKVRYKAEEVYRNAEAAGSGHVTLYVITGTKTGPGNEWLKGRVAFPDYFWKAVCYPGDESAGLRPFGVGFYGRNVNFIEGFLAYTSYSGVWVSYVGSMDGQDHSKMMTCATINGTFGEESVSQAVAMVMAHNPRLVQSEVTSRGDDLQESVLPGHQLMGAFEAHWGCQHSPQTAHYTSCYRSVQLSGVSASARISSASTKIGSASAKIGSRSASVGKTRMKQPVCIGIATPSGKEGGFRMNVEACPAGEVPDVPSQPLFAMVGNPEVDERHVVCAGNLLRTEEAADLLCVSHPELWLSLQQAGRTVRAAGRPECGVKPCRAGTGHQTDGDQARETPTDVKTGKTATKKEEREPRKKEELNAFLETPKKTKLEYCVQNQVTQEAPGQECADLCSYQTSNCPQFFAGSPWPASSYTTVGSQDSCMVCQTTAGEGAPLYAAVYNMHYRVPEYTASAITRDPGGKTYERPKNDLWYRVQLGLCPTELHEAIEDDCDNNTATWGITGKDDLCPLPSDVTDMLWRYGDCGKCQSLSGDYSGCGYYFNKGHLNPNAINNQTQAVQEGTFSLLNSAPQAADFNQCTWQPYECAVGLIAEKVFTKAAGTGSDVRSIYVITGTKLGRGHKWLKGRAAIPDFYWKAVCYPGDEAKGIAPFAFAFYGANRNCTKVKTVELSVFEEWLYRGSVYPESRLFPGPVCEGNVSVWTDDNGDSFEAFLEKVTPECRKGTGDLETRCPNPDREACQKPSKPVAPPVKPSEPQGDFPPPPPMGSAPTPEMPPGIPPPAAVVPAAEVAAEDKCIMYKVTDEAPVDRCMERCANNYQSWQECPNFFVGTPWPPSSYSSTSPGASCPICQMQADREEALFATRFHTELRIPEYTADAIIRPPHGPEDQRDDDGTLWNRVQLGPLTVRRISVMMTARCGTGSSWEYTADVIIRAPDGPEDQRDDDGTLWNRVQLGPLTVWRIRVMMTARCGTGSSWAPHFNQHVWESFEEKVRYKAEEVYDAAGSGHKTLYVITGTKTGPGNEWLKGRVAFPEYFWKAVCYPGDESAGLRPFGVGFYGRNVNFIEVEDMVALGLSEFDSWLYDGGEDHIFQGSVCATDVDKWYIENE
uniref:Peptidase metallopeptidase domain-containing protein n=1 Tax=Branchiostoma floridae TaxID=7739 RepID=C3ZRM5_BRAFL|eukprot:XP_002588814.1 hypothetical protein BRAFLDRAFT_89755 [Branchiostoma floridae]